jgi:thiol:disulfide interchange protein DsbD
MKSMKYRIGLILLCLFTFSTALLAQDAELLPPEQAFSLRAWIEGDQIIAEYRIAPGYYMYRERFSFEIEDSDQPARLGNASFPVGKIKEDEFFGKMEVYRDQVRIVLPLIFDAEAASKLQIKAVGQGCADIGVCYPPLKQSLAMNVNSTQPVLPAAWVNKPTAENEPSDIASLQSILDQVTSPDNSQQSEITGDSESGSALNLLRALGADIGIDDEDEVLHPDQAFILSARLDANNTIQTNILLAKNIYLYLDKVKITMVDGDGHSLGPIALPKGKKKVDEFLGPTTVIYKQLNVSIPIISTANASDQFTLAYRYQGCVEDRICYPPITKYIEVDAQNGLVLVSSENPVANETASAMNAFASDPMAGQESAPISEQDQFTNFLKNKSLLVVVGLFFLAGIGLTFTPCVFPMIPILSSIIAGQGPSITTFKAFTLSLVYVFAMAITYATVGAIAGFYGSEFNIQIWFQDPIILSIFAAIFVLLALSMFGFYEIQMPNAIQSRLTTISNSQQGGTLIGVGLMGIFSAIIVGPCITAPLVGALFYITQTQDWQLGGLALFALGMGMGVPLLMIGTSAGNILPRAGAWMDIVKSFFGVILLGVAIWLLERILPVSITMVLIAALMIASSIYMGALDSLSETDSGWRRLFKSIGVLILIYGIAYLIGAAAGTRDLLQPLNGLSGSIERSEQSDQHLVFRQIKGQEGLQLALYDSVQQDRKSMLDFYADWCISCKEMERYTFNHPAVLAALSNVSTIQADVTDNDQMDSRLMSSLGIYGPPAILFFDTNGQEIRNRRVVGEMLGEEFAQHVIATFQ